MEGININANNRANILTSVLKSVLDETDYRIDLIVEMVHDHGDMVIIEAREYVDNDSVRQWNFKAFLFGAKVAVIKRLRERMSDAMILALTEIVPDASRYGSILSCGRCNENVAELFMDMLVDGVDEERIGELMMWDVELYGGKQDEPDDDVDTDRLLDELVTMMEGHGIRGDVRAKAKEFLAAVAMNTLNEVIHEDE
ncbi:MAG: hypothetical protein J7K40_11440 [candidate division Zixibacteria bacterium]|nr:hypothetical protein [candidate division Zixibacteria bacterium]